MTEKTTLSKTEARQGKTSNVRYVLVISTAAAIAALAVVMLVII